MRFILGFIGAVFAAILLISFFSNLATYFQSPPEELAAEAFHKEPKHLALKSDGPLGKFDKAQLQRGFQVYAEVCSACHSMRLVAFRDLAQLGYTENEVKAAAAGFTVPGIDPNTGEAN